MSDKPASKDAPPSPKEVRSLDAPSPPIGFVIGGRDDQTKSSTSDKSGGSSDSDEEGGTLERQNSKVRFSDVDLVETIKDESKKTDSGSEDEADTLRSDSSYTKKLAAESGDISRQYIRRTSLSLSHSKEPNPEDVHLTHPRKRVSIAYESLDYNEMESQKFIQNQKNTDPKEIKRLSVMRWFINFAVGIYVAVIAVLVWLLIKYISIGKFMAIYKIIGQCETIGCTIPGLVVWILFNIFFVFIGAYLVTYHAPSAAGSGIPQVKCYLNGIKMPGLMSLRTLLAKAGGVVLSVSGGLACGKEGPMIHSGAICASSLASGRFHCGKKHCEPTCCDGLRADEERRDIVAAGAASGVSAAFASPVGGVLFALEEGASFLKQDLTWRMLFSSMVAGLVLNLLMSAIKGHVGDMSNPGLISFGFLGDIEFRTFEIPIFLIMGIIGGLTGAAFVAINYKVTLFRRKRVTKAWMKVAEACLVAACSAILLYVIIYVFPDCKPIKGFNVTDPYEGIPVYDDLHPTGDTVLGFVSTPAGSAGGEQGHDVHRRSAGGGHGDGQSPEAENNGHHGNASAGHEDPYGDHGHGYVFRGMCPYGQRNKMADILFKTPEGGLHAMLHSPIDEWSVGPLFCLCILYHLLTTWTYGLNVSSGLFIPSLLIGAIWGRIIGIGVMTFIPAAGTNIAKYSLVGAAAQLGGFVRMTISLTVIVIECTGDITFGIPMILTLIMAKWMGDFFNPGIYDLHIEIWGAPLLGWNPPDMCHHVPAREVMTKPVDCIRTIETIERLQDLVDDPSGHHGFPVVEDYDPDDASSDNFGRLKGFIMKSQLEDILDRIEEEGEDENGMVNLTEYMDISPYSVQEDVSLPRIFKLFRSIGLRHLVVVNDSNRVVGMITRINLARFRSELVKGKFHIEELEVVRD